MPVDSPKSAPPPVPGVTGSKAQVAAAAAAAADAKNIVRRKLTGYVGFANLPNQWHRKSVRKGFNFNVMVVGTLALLNVVDNRTPRLVVVDKVPKAGRVNRMNIIDNRIHACVYFIQPTGHSLKPLDIEVMRRLHTKVNLIPVIAKSDTMTDEEVASFKLRVCNSDQMQCHWHRLTRTDSRRHQPPQDSHL